MSIHAKILHAELAERVLEKLGFSAAPELTLDGLSSLYGAWCRKVPFDNVRKLIHLQAPNTAELPGDSADDFFEAWLLYGAGGTCWAGNGALCSLLESLGFASVRGLATMLVAPRLPPNHGTVVVDVADERYIVDASILHGAPLKMTSQAPVTRLHPAWGVRVTVGQGQPIIHWRPLHDKDGLGCRIEKVDVSPDIFRDFHERSRPWSPFNYQLYGRINRFDSVVGTAFGQRIDIDSTGEVVQHPLAAADRTRFVVEELGIAEELAAKLPPDRPTPPPPQEPPV